jgi:hypothetical protein
MNYSANKMAAKHCLSAQCIVVDIVSLRTANQDHVTTNSHAPTLIHSRFIPKRCREADGKQEIDVHLSTSLFICVQIQDYRR